MQILGDYQIRQKITRMAYEILENNIDADEIILAGINNNGLRLAELILSELEKLTQQKLILASIKLNPAAPLLYPVVCSVPPSEFVNKPVIVIDDVANTGRTTFYAFKIFMEVLPEKIEVAVLVDRKHKMFPVKVDYVGMTLATTIQENIKANLLSGHPMSVVLN